MKKKITFKVTFELPEGASVADAQAYVRDAVETWCGSLCPGTPECNYEDADPFFNLDRASVKVTRLRQVFK